jgi:hypothetical protein
MSKGMLAEATAVDRSRLASARVSAAAETRKR